MGKTVGDIATTQGLLVTYPNESMQVALRRLGTRDVGRMPVVESEESNKASRYSSPQGYHKRL